MYFWNARIDALTRDQLRAKLVDFLNSDGVHMVTTVNPEMLLEVRRNKKFADVLAKSDLGLVDGVGLLWLLRSKGCRLERFTGVAMVEELAKMCAEHTKKMFLIGGENSQRAAENLQKKYGVEVRGVKGPRVNDDGVEEGYGTISEDHSSVVLVGFGAPKQELWIEKNRAQFPSVRIIAGVGGSFDMIAGALPRAPLIFRRLGLEWLWRLILEPRRIRRIWNAVVVFPVVALFKKITYGNPN